jgi:hypothetical protein
MFKRLNKRPSLFVHSDSCLFLQLGDVVCKGQKQLFFHEVDFLSFKFPFISSQCVTFESSFVLILIFRLKFIEIFLDLAFDLFSESQIGQKDILLNLHFFEEINDIGATQEIDLIRVTLNCVVNLVQDSFEFGEFSFGLHYKHNFKVFGVNRSKEDETFLVT